MSKYENDVDYSNNLLEEYKHKNKQLLEQVEK
jgi:hypothetical protein